ncbi:amidohydrolase family protein [Mangrovicoccus ximenensis]|uniref:amidohydrolase family protein n=1 Tax=Mangrovicoccus ximenensis TaxID=1911570 RepID=UPI000D379AC1|nr:amidohydrolase family protein [Mangrovicoccus ximenensis]
MISRRTLIAAAASLPAAPFLVPASAAADASQPETAAGFALPPGACDCHVHVHPEGYPLYEGRTYTPGGAEVGELEAMMAALGLDRAVIVTPSIYGPDNSATLSGLHALGERGRGVAVIDGTTTAREMRLLDAAGIRGVRLNLSTGGVSQPEVARGMVEETLARIDATDWHLQLNTNLAMIAALHDFLADQPRTLVFDHFGGAQPDASAQPDAEALVSLVASGKAYVKLSVKGGPRDDYSVFDPLAAALVEAGPDRVLWGTNWPHPNAKPPAGGTAKDLTPLFDVDDGAVLGHLPVWAPDLALREKMLVANPARLYGFGQA